MPPVKPTASHTKYPLITAAAVALGTSRVTLWRALAGIKRNPELAGRYNDFVTAHIAAAAPLTGTHTAEFLRAHLPTDEQYGIAALEGARTYVAYLIAALARAAAAEAEGTALTDEAAEAAEIAADFDPEFLAELKDELDTAIGKLKPEGGKKP